MIRLINDILDLSKIEAGHIQLNLALISLIDVVERALRGLRNLPPRMKLHSSSSAHRIFPCAEADSDRIEQVVTNLLSNAMKFSPSKGEISAYAFSVQRTGDQLQRF